LHRLKPEIAMAVSATACLVRWALLAESTSIVAIAAAEPLHGFTFALLHLSCMRVLATIVPRELAGLAQAIYGTVGVGLTSAVLTFFSGSLYTEFGAQGFWAMFLIALSALPDSTEYAHDRSTCPPLCRPDSPWRSTAWVVETKAPAPVVKLRATQLSAMRRGPRHRSAPSRARFSAHYLSAPPRDPGYAPSSAANWNCGSHRTGFDTSGSCPISGGTPSLAAWA
jgi:PPP family 3-phenylpropionic acid transporter